MKIKLIFSSIIIFIASLLYSQSDDTSYTLTDLRNQFSNATEDTTKINLLFDMAYKYLDGTSDSLLLYIAEAIEIIDLNLEVYLRNDIENKEMIGKYRYYKIRALIEFGIEHFFRSDYPKALEYYSQALEVSKIYGDIGLISECYSEIGIVYKNQGEYDLALDYYTQALELAQQTTDTSWVASCQVNIGNVYKAKGYLIVAQKYYMDALSILEELGHDRRIAACFQNIGDVYNEQRDYNLALEYYSRSLELAIKTSDKVRETTCYLNIGYAYVNMNHNIAARGYLEKAITLYNETGYQHELDICYILLGDTWLSEENYSKAIEYYFLALDISELEKDRTSITEIEMKLGTAFIKKGNNKKALQYFLSSLKVANTLGSLSLMIETNECLSDYYESNGQFEKAILYHKKHDRLKDSLFNAEKYKAILEMEVKYNSEKKEQELALLTEKNEVQKLKLNRRNRIYFTSLIGLGMFLIIGYILFRNRQLKTIHRSIELEQKLMRSQMNPHFIFNSLIAIQSYIYKQEAVKAGDYLARFAELIRITLENSREEFVLLEKELKMLNAYLELQGLRFEDKFDYHINTDQKINVSATLIPPMMAQPFIENAVEHGLRHRETKGYVKIYFEKKEKYIQCIVEDNGVGRQNAKEFSKRKDHKSMATSITRDRLKILSKKEHQKFSLKINDMMDEESNSLGTKVVFNIPFRESV